MIIAGTVNPFQGFEIDPEQLTPDCQQFTTLLPRALAAWTEAGIRLVWLKVPLAKAALIPIAVEHGFEFHHSQTDYLMLTCALEADTFIPHYATHYIGAGGVVIDANRNLLVVSERFRGDRSRPYWKLPGGALHPGENLVAAVMREVQEETGVATTFQHLVAFRHWHGYRFGKSDIYMVCRLAPLSRDIDKDDHEIDHCIWMPLDDYLNHEHVGDFNRALVQAAISGVYLKLTQLPGDLPGQARADRHEFFFHPDFGPPAD